MFDGETTDIVPVTFAEMSRKDKADAGLRIASDYMTTVKGRLDKLQEEGLPNLDRTAFEAMALDNVSTHLGAVEMELALENVARLPQMAAMNSAGEKGKFSSFDQIVDDMSVSIAFVPGKDAQEIVGQYKAGIREQNDERAEIFVGGLMDQYPEMKEMFDGGDGPTPGVETILRETGLEDDRIGYDLAYAYGDLKAIRGNDVRPDIIPDQVGKFRNSSYELMRDFLAIKHGEKTENVLGGEGLLELSGETRMRKSARRFTEQHSSKK